MAAESFTWQMEMEATTGESWGPGGSLLDLHWLLVAQINFLLASFPAWQDV